MSIFWWGCFHRGLSRGETHTDTHTFISNSSDRRDSSEWPIIMSTSFLCLCGLILIVALIRELMECKWTYVCQWKRENEYESFSAFPAEQQQGILNIIVQYLEQTVTASHNEKLTFFYKPIIIFSPKFYFLLSREKSYLKHWRL